MRARHRRFAIIADGCSLLRERGCNAHVARHSHAKAIDDHVIKHRPLRREARKRAAEAPVNAHFPVSTATLERVAAAILDAAKSRRRDRGRDRRVAGGRAKRDRAQGRGRDDRVQPRQGHRRHRLHRRSAAVTRAPPISPTIRFARPSTRRSPSRKFTAEDPYAGLGGSRASCARPARSRSLLSRGSSRSSRRSSSGRAAEAAALAVDPRDQQQRGFDGRARRVGIRLREFARLSRRLPQLAPPHRLRGRRRAGRRDAARLLVHGGARARRPAIRPTEVGRIAGTRTARRLNATQARDARVPGDLRGARGRRPDRILRPRRIGRQPVPQIVVPARLARAAGIRAACPDPRRAASAARARQRAVRQRRRGHGAARRRARTASSKAIFSAATRRASWACRPPATRGGSAQPRASRTGDDDLDRVARTNGPRTCSITEQLGQGVNPVTGDFSRGAAGFWIEDGAIAYPVEEITIAGNLQARCSPTSSRSAATSTRRGSRHTGSILIARMTVAGH